MDFSLRDIIAIVGCGCLVAYCIHSKLKSLEIIQNTEIYRSNMKQIDSAIWDPEITFKWLSMMAPSENILRQLEPICRRIHFDGDCLVIAIELLENYRNQIVCMLTFYFIVCIFILNFIYCCTELMHRQRRRVDFFSRKFEKRTTLLSRE
jgi:hypothetical protein